MEVVAMEVGGGAAATTMKMPSVAWQMCHTPYWESMNL